MGKEIYGVLQEKQKKSANSLTKNKGNREKVKRGKRNRKKLKWEKENWEREMSEKGEMRMKAVRKKRREINKWR